MGTGQVLFSSCPDLRAPSRRPALWPGCGAPLPVSCAAPQDSEGAQRAPGTGRPDAGRWEPSRSARGQAGGSRAGAGPRRALPRRFRPHLRGCLPPAVRENKGGGAGRPRAPRWRAPGAPAAARSASARPVPRGRFRRLTCCASVSRARGGRAPRVQRPPSARAGGRVGPRTAASGRLVRQRVAPLTRARDAGPPTTFGRRECPARAPDPTPGARRELPCAPPAFQQPGEPRARAPGPGASSRPLPPPAAAPAPERAPSPPPPPGNSRAPERAPRPLPPERRGPPSARRAPPPLPAPSPQARPLRGPPSPARRAARPPGSLPSRGRHFPPKLQRKFASGRRRRRREPPSPSAGPGFPECMGAGRTAPGA
ncbi:proline-rich protein 2-like [Sus scrofa]|uniref:proline-rich protein 2-like n=1 Tax=Sus scrofa TaxID=9823 RepID=UPI000A2B593D|nr:proline-rich protein 2-like [Sus scrofa]